MSTIEVAIPEHRYRIQIGSRLGAALADSLEALRPTRVLLISDQNVARLHLAAVTGAFSDGLRARLDTLIVAPGEASKSLAVAERAYDRLLNSGADRASVLLGVGGGVVGDLTGFVAATYMRGVRFVLVATTVEAAIDASIGGKTALNHPGAKNLIGAFHQPAAVFIDADLLETLPERDFVAGLAESVKHAAICDSRFLEWHEEHAASIRSRDSSVLEPLLARNCEIKSEVVAADERDRGRRAILNHGHTIGHAIEHLLGYELRHGECVALGMLVENRIAVERGWLAPNDAARIADVMGALGLPRRLPHALNADDVLSATRADKKTRDGKVGYVLLDGLGAARLTYEIEDSEVRRALGAIAPA